MREGIVEAYDLGPSGLLFIDGLDDAIIGVSTKNLVPVVVYSTIKILENLVRQGMGIDEAKEFIVSNIEGAFMGEHTPLIVDDLF